ncbi:MAG: hypothetical protein S4CHLAM6_08660 [Chlamydiae bacterium]|nr:hypothetical protein [Chlamydiota bacterium]
MADLILFDESCNFCQRCILFILKRDKKKNFIFSDLKGQAAQSMSDFLHISDNETIVFIEHYNTQFQRVFYRSKAVFKILYKLGGIYKLVGWKYVLPSFLFDWAYNLVAKKRKCLCKKNVPYKDKPYKEQFLP